MTFLAIIRGLWSAAMSLLRWFGEGLFVIAKHPVAMFTCACLCMATMVVGIWLALAWTKHVREAARGTVANVEAAHEREDNADEALARAAVQARKAAAEGERKRQAEEAALAAASPPTVTDPALPPGVRKSEPAAGKKSRVRRKEPSLWASIQAALGGGDSAGKR